MSRQKAFVTYGFDDIQPVGYFNGRLNTYGCTVFMKTEDNKTLSWNTVVAPTKKNNVEKFVNEKVQISYEVVEEKWNNIIAVKNVRFINPKE